MNIEKLFKKAEKFFGLGVDEQEKREQKRVKLENSLEKKILSIKTKIKRLDDSEKKRDLKKQLKVLKDFLQKIKEN